MKDFLTGIRRCKGKRSDSKVEDTGACVRDFCVAIVTVDRCRARGCRLETEEARDHRRINLSA